MSARIVLLCFILPLLALAQPRPASAQASTEGYANLPAQKIGPNDLLSIAVYEQPELTRTVRVSSEGFLRLPMLKQQVRAEGLLPAQLEGAIADALKTEQLILEPIVTVIIAEYLSHPVSVGGAVRNPMTFQAVEPTKLLDAINRAGGLTPEAGPEVLVTRLSAAPGEKPAALTRRIPVRGLIDDADPDLNLVLTGGEEVRVPEVGKIFVVGNVKKPGAFPVQDNDDTSVLHMLALAEGLQGVTGRHAYIYRRDISGKKNEISVDLQDILDRKAPDVTLMARDILYVPENKGRKLGLAALEKAVLFATTGGAAALSYGVIR